MVCTISGRDGVHRKASVFAPWRGNLRAACDERNESRPMRCRFSAEIGGRRIGKAGRAMRKMTIEA